MKNAIALHAVLAGLPLANAAGIGVAAINAADKDWDAAFSHPNATSSTSITGYNVSRPYPAGSEEWDGDGNWTLTLSLAADIPTKVDYSNRTYVNGMELKLGLPDAFKKNSTSDPSWSLCQSLWVSSKLRVSKEDPIDPTCKGVVSDKCQKALQELGTEPGQNWCTKANNFRGTELPSACEGDLGVNDKDADISGAGFSTHGTNYTMNNANPFTNTGIKYGDQIVDKGNTTDYDLNIHSVWIVATRFAEVDGTSVPGSVVCLRAEDVAEGSRGLDGDSSAGGLSPRGGLVAVLAVAVAAAVLL